MKKRAVRKESSLQNILQAGAIRIREKGLSGSGIATIMQEAGLTHGAFYSHFRTKNDLLIASLHHALVENRPRWISSNKHEPWPQRLSRLAKRYLTPAHRDDLANSCALASLASEAARANEDFRRAYEAELQTSIEAICDESKKDAVPDPERFAEAVMMMALCIGGMNLSRAVKSKDLSDQVLAICGNAVERIVQQTNHSSTQSATPLQTQDDDLQADMTVDQFPIKTYEKLRYADTDRQGHVNNAIFSTMLETGRVEVLYAPANPLADTDCSFVIAGQQLNFLAEIRWPGQVDIGTRVEKIGRSSITFTQALFQEKRLCATAKTVIVQMNERTRHSAPLNHAAIERLKKLMD